MNRIIFYFFLLTLSCLIASLTACAPKKIRPGFAEHLSTVYVNTAGAVIWTEHESRGLWYSEVLLRPLDIRFTPGFDVYHVTERARRINQAAIRYAVEQALGNRYPLVQGPKSRTLIIEPALTNVLNTTELIPLVEKLGYSSTRELPIVALELRFIDASTGDLVAAAISARSPYLFKANLNAPRSVGETSEPFEPFAKGLRRALDKARP